MKPVYILLLSSSAFSSQQLLNFKVAVVDIV